MNTEAKTKLESQIEEIKERYESEGKELDRQNTEFKAQLENLKLELNASNEQNERLGQRIENMNAEKTELACKYHEFEQTMG